MNLDEIEKAWEQDAEIDKTDAGVESLKIPKLHSKYTKLLMVARREFREKSAIFSKLYRYKHEYYLGLLSKEDLDKFGWKPFAQRIIRQDLPIYLDADDDLSKASVSVENVKLCIEKLEDILKSIHQRSYQINNHVNWSKFMAGVG